MDLTHGVISLGGVIHSLGLCLQSDWTNFLLSHSPVFVNIDLSIRGKVFKSLEDVWRQQGKILVYFCIWSRMASEVASTPPPRLVSPWFNYL